MIVCSRCSKENQDHYKFCLGCGAELPRDSSKPRSISAPGNEPRTTDAPPAPVRSAGSGALASAPQLEVEPSPPEPVLAEPAPEPVRQREAEVLNAGFHAVYFAEFPVWSISSRLDCLCVVF